MFFILLAGTIMHFTKPTDNDCRWLKRQIETSKGKISPGDFEIIYQVSIDAAKKATEEIDEQDARDKFFCSYVRGKTEEIFAKYK